METGYIITTPTPHPAPRNMLPRHNGPTRRNGLTHPKWSIDQYVFAILKGNYETTQIPEAQLPPETKTALGAHLSRVGIDIDSTELTCNWLTFTEGTQATREAYQVTAIAEDPPDFVGTYLFDVTGRIAMIEGASWI